MISGGQCLSMVVRGSQWWLIVFLVVNSAQLCWWSVVVSGDQ